MGETASTSAASAPADPALRLVGPTTIPAPHVLAASFANLIMDGTLPAAMLMSASGGRTWCGT